MSRLNRILSTDFPFVTLIVAVLAVVLSQLKPIYSYFERPDFSVALGTSANLMDVWGEGAFQPFLQIDNLGDSPGFASEVEFYLEHESNAEARWVMPTLTYFPAPDEISIGAQATQIPFRSLKISANDTWGNFVYVANILSPERQDRVTNLVGRYGEAFSKELTEGKIWRANQKLTEEAIDLCDDFRESLISGKYLVLTVVKNKEGQIMCTATNQFVLSDSHIKILESKEDYYEMGGGIIFPIPPINITVASVNLLPMTRSGEERRLRQAYLQMKEQNKAEEPMSNPPSD